jgi:hypothetical protein
MPWFPDFVSAVELARRQTRAEGQADPAGQYFKALNKGDTHVLEKVWPGEVAALAAGDAELVASTFAPDGYYCEPGGPSFAHRGTAELRSFFTACFSAGGGIGLQHCAVTDDGVRCALEYNCVRWGSHDLPPQAGLGVYERGPDGLLAAARVYDDVEAPVIFAR